MEFIKTLICIVVKALMWSMSFIPIKNNRLLFCPMNGNYYCNLKYITDYLAQTCDGQYELIWVAGRNSQTQFPSYVKLCTKFSPSFFYYALTAKVVIYNCGIGAYLRKREGQYFIETWHGGGAYKRVQKRYTWIQRLRFRQNLARYDYVISSSAAFSRVFQLDLQIPHAEYLPYGMPRNDIFFDPARMTDAAARVRERYGVGAARVVMYAPTFRDDGMANTLDFAGLLRWLAARYGAEFVLFVRCHPHVASDIFVKYHGMASIIDVSEYPDMQELLCATDVLLTDYSSSMWDFSLTYRPCFIYATDIDSYRHERDFHTAPSSWPFPLATDNAELERNITEFNYEEYVRAVERHHADLGSYEDGHAAERVAELLSRLCQQ